MKTEYRLSLPPQSPETAEPKARAVLEKAMRQVGFLPNMYRYMANSPGLLETYLDGCDRFRRASGAAFTPIEQEVVFLTLSRANGCHYCMAAHSMLADKSGMAPGVLEAIRAGDEIPDPKLDALGTFTHILWERRGLPSRAEVRRFLDAGYSERHILEILLALAVKTLSNYANHLFHTPVDGLFAEYNWEEQEGDH